MVGLKKENHQNNMHVIKKVIPPDPPDKVAIKLIIKEIKKYYPLIYITYLDYGSIYSTIRLTYGWWDFCYIYADKDLRHISVCVKNPRGIKNTCKAVQEAEIKLAELSLSNFKLDIEVKEDW